MRISTGLTSDRGATELEVSWPRDGHTTVEFIGEHQNSEPVDLDGTLLSREVLAWYLDQMRMYSEEKELGF